MIFRRPEVDVQINVNNSVFRAGDRVDAHVRLLPKGDFHVRQGRVEFVCIETWVQRVDSQYGPSYHRKTNILSSQGETFMEGQTVRNGVPYSADLRATVPRDALPDPQRRPGTEDRTGHRVGGQDRRGRGQGA